MIRAAGLVAAFLLAACQGGGSATPPLEPTAVEEDLLFGVRRDAAVDCQPDRDGLPDGALGAVTCFPANDLATRVTLVRWQTEGQLLDACFGALAANGVGPRSGDCVGQGEGEAGYWPGDDHGVEVTGRQGCFSVANEMVVLVTLPPTVLAEVHGRAEAADSLTGWVWIGNLDVPGSPTIWNEEGPINPEKG